MDDGHTVHYDESDSIVCLTLLNIRRTIKAKGYVDLMLPVVHSRRGQPPGGVRQNTVHRARKRLTTGVVIPTKFDDYIREVEKRVKAEGPEAVAPPAWKSSSAGTAKSPRSAVPIPKSRQWPLNESEAALFNVLRMARRLWQNSASACVKH
jgi:hypothetical protein